LKREVIWPISGKDTSTLVWRNTPAMKRFLRRLLVYFVRDDLFVRVVWLLTGLLPGGIGVLMLIQGATLHLSTIVQVLFYWPISILLTAMGGVAASRCVLSPKSRLARYLDTHLPDAVADEWILLMLVVYVPAAFLTFFLRLLGVKGQRGSSMTRGMMRSSHDRPGHA